MGLAILLVHRALDALAERRDALQDELLQELGAGVLRGALADGRAVHLEVPVVLVARARVEPAEERVHDEIVRHAPPRPQIRHLLVLGLGEDFVFGVERLPPTIDADVPQHLAEGLGVGLVGLVGRVDSAQ